VEIPASILLQQADLTAVPFVTRSIAEAMLLADRVIMMSRRPAASPRSSRVTCSVGGRPPEGVSRIPSLLENTAGEET